MSIWNLTGAIYRAITNSLPNSPVLNSAQKVLKRSGTTIIVPARIQGNNDSYNVPVFKVTGTVRIIEQYAILTNITNLSNMTNVYADLWADTGGAGTIIGVLTTDGMTLSDAEEGSYFTKDKEVGETYSLVKSNTGGINETRPDEFIGRAFTVTQRKGVDTYIRFNYTTNTVLDFVMDIYFTYFLMDGSNLEVVL
jgi:hypothetical protein